MSISVNNVINIDTYKLCLDFTVNELLNELKLRNWLAKSRLEDLVTHPQIGNLILTKEHFNYFWFNKIQNKQPFAKAYGPNFCNAHLPYVPEASINELLHLAESPAINIIKGKNLLDISQSFEDLKRRITESNVSDKKGISTLQEIMDSPVRTSPSSLIAKIDLSHTDSHLKKAFSLALEQWRTELRIEQNLARSWKPVKFYNFLDYNVLLILDYLFLAKQFGHKKDLKSLCRLIKGNDNQFETFLDVEFHFSRSVLDKRNINTLEQMIGVVPGLGNCLIKEVGKIL